MTNIYLFKINLTAVGLTILLAFMITSTSNREAKNILLTASLIIIVIQYFALIKRIKMVVKEIKAGKK